MRGDLAHFLYELEGGVDGCLGGLEAGDDFYAFLDWDGVHEMRTYDS